MEYKGCFPVCFMPLRVRLCRLNHEGWIIALNSFLEEKIDDFVVAEFNSALIFGYFKLDQYYLRLGIRDRLGPGQPGQQTVG